MLAGPRQPVPSVVLEVADQGRGCAGAGEHVFERFYRADQARTEAGGTGLGLAIVAALVAAHGGTVAVETAPGQGATFRIALPLAPEAHDAERTRVTRPANEPGQTAKHTGRRPGPAACRGGADKTGGAAARRGAPPQPRRGRPGRRPASTRGNDRPNRQAWTSSGCS